MLFKGTLREKERKPLSKRGGIRGSFFIAFPAWDATTQQSERIGKKEVKIE
jgi:hypothetical protein